MAEVLAFPLRQPDAPVVIPDTEQRSLALDITRSVIVEAPAGSGKTGLLIQRLLKLLAADNVTDPAQILAITFTRKATYEMRDRVLGQLALAREGQPPANAFDRETRPLAEAALARDHQLGWGLLEHPGRLNIATIDAFCAQIARSLPVLSGSGGQVPVEDASELYAEAATRTLHLLGGSDPALSEALETLLLHRDGDLGNCVALIAEMLGWRDQWGELIPLTGEQLTDEYLEEVTLPKLEKALDRAICRALTRLDQIMPAALCHELALLAHRMSHAAGYQGAESPIALCRELSSAPGAAAADLDHWRALAHLAIAPSTETWRKSAGMTNRNLKFEISKQERAELAFILESASDNDALCEALCGLTNLPPVRYPPEQWMVAKALFRVLSRALVELQLVFVERGECDFAEFSLIARQALRQAGAVEDLANAGGFPLEHLLVDEMQDTSSSQYELIRLLTQHWDGAGQTVFLVGDPKQSIYLFRQARVARFIDTLRAGKLGDLPLTALYLSANFRSQANLVAGFNDTFTKLFPASLDRGDNEAVPYHAASAFRPAAPEREIVWHRRSIAYATDKTACAKARAEAREQNAAEMRRIVGDWRGRPLPPERANKPWKIAVLVRNRRHLLGIVRAFRQEPAIPFRAVKIEPLAERQEVLDLFALTRALLHPADRTAWLALLRTPWCGLTLRDLHRLAGEDEYAWHEHTVFSLIAERGELLSPDGVARLEPFWNVMVAALGQAGRMPLARLVERTWRAFGADAFATREEVTNIQRFFALVDELEGRWGPVNIDSLKKAMARLYAAESVEADAVDLMTIHNAKGLEWDVVLVPELESGSGRNAPRLLSWLEIEGGNEEETDVAHGVIAPVQAKGTQSLALARWMRSIESEREAAERKRLFYVVCTRAREELHLFATPDRKKDGSFNPKADSLLKAAWPAARADFEALKEEPGALDELAAGLELVKSSTPQPRTIERIPLEAFPASSRAPAVAGEGAASPLFSRPEGGFEARVFGNSMHAFLELLAARIAGGDSVAALLQELPTWQPRIGTLVRAGGMAPQQIARATANILRGLTQTLESEAGRWLLAKHRQAISEAAIAFEAGSLRLDRTFLAGANAGSTGETHLWIIDYKTGTHGPDQLEQYLAGEKKKYAPQLETYGRLLAARGLPIRLALFYPMLPKLIDWPFEPEI